MPVTAPRFVVLATSILKFSSYLGTVSVSHPVAFRLVDGYHYICHSAEWQIGIKQTMPKPLCHIRLLGVSQPPRHDTKRHGERDARRERRRSPGHDGSDGSDGSESTTARHDG